ncbi:MAG TPA: hypothetical protein VM686_22975 [Polyangiaceae bacterium]|nr:hypothetical protein [Polyangiaceae bacterium]
MGRALALYIGHCWLAALGPVVLVACTAGVDASALEPGPANGDEELSLVFRPATALTLAPRETRELSVVLAPAGRQRVRFALLSGATGDGPADAALDRSEATTDEDGIGTVVLTAPSAPVTFTVRASIDDGPETSIGVSVSASGFAELEVVPSYAGKRPVQGWVATVRAGLTCDDPELAGTPPPDGDLTTTSADDSDLVVQKVPVGPVLAVTARVGHYIGGCATVTEAREGERNRIIVPVSDRPIQLGTTRLLASFGFDSLSPQWEAQLEVARESVISGMRGSAGDDLSALLDALEAVVPEEQRALLAEARVSRGWDAALQAAYPGEDANVLSATARQWMQAGFERLYAPDAIQGELGAETEDPARAILTLLRVGGQPATEAGFPATAPVAWSANSHDVLLVGTNFLWVPQDLLTALALEPALEASPTASGVDRALANRLDCGRFVGALTGAGEPQGEIYPACTQLCSINHCRAAVALLWERGLSATSFAPPLFSLSASGDATVGDGAEAVSLQGSWVGRFSADDEAATAGGPFSGTVPEE